MSRLAPGGHEVQPVDQLEGVTRVQGSLDPGTSPLGAPREVQGPRRGCHGFGGKLEPPVTGQVIPHNNGAIAASLCMRGTCTVTV